MTSSHQFQIAWISDGGMSKQNEIALSPRVCAKNGVVSLTSPRFSGTAQHLRVHDKQLPHLEARY